MNVDFGAQSMVSPLRSVLLCSPETAGWNEASRALCWSELGFLRPPNPADARRQFDELRSLLEKTDAEIFVLGGSPELSLDAVYAHDPSIVTDQGAICLRMGKAAREKEPAIHGAWYRTMGIPVFGELRLPATAEGGDIVWLDGSTLLIGRGYRTNGEGIRQLREMLSPAGVTVIPAPLPHGRGPAVCLHLMSLLSLLDEKTALVDLPLLAVETVELLCDRGYQLIEIEEAERESLACNVLSLGNGRLIALAENAATNRRLRQRGFEVLTFTGGEVALNGGGGPTCLTRPLSRS